MQTNELDDFFRDSINSGMVPPLIVVLAGSNGHIAALRLTDRPPERLVEHNVAGALVRPLFGMLVGQGGSVRYFQITSDDARPVLQ